ncbi:MAG: response regulator [Planctomycetes bacterium]|nr:response regulator [Planctomycetota bacterium]
MPESAPKILILDEDPGVRNALPRLLRRHGIEVATAINGERAIKRLRRGEDFGAIIMDLALPDMAGRDFVSIVAKEDLFDLRKVLILTAMQNVDNATAYMQFGCAGYFGKPYDNARILCQIFRILGIEPPASELEAII